MSEISKQEQKPTWSAPEIEQISIVTTEMILKGSLT